MSDYSNISSEQELMKLRNEGNITDDEYEQLRTAMQANAQNSIQTPEAEPKEEKTKCKLAITGFSIMLVGFTLPFMLYYLANQAAQAHDPDMRTAIAPWFFMGVLFEIIALTIGIIAWPERLAKATVIPICIGVVLGILGILASI